MGKRMLAGLSPLARLTRLTFGVSLPERHLPSGERSIMRRGLLTYGLATAMLIGLRLTSADAAAIRPMSPEVLGLGARSTPVALCGYTCSAVADVPGPPQVCYQRGLQYCGPSRGGGGYGGGVDMAVAATAVVDMEAVAVTAVAAMEEAATVGTEATAADTVVGAAGRKPASRGGEAGRGILGIFRRWSGAPGRPHEPHAGAELLTRCRYTVGPG